MYKSQGTKRKLTHNTRILPFAGTPRSNCCNELVSDGFAQPPHRPRSRNATTGRGCSEFRPSWPLLSAACLPRSTKTLPQNATANARSETTASANSTTTTGARTDRRSGGAGASGRGTKMRNDNRRAPQKHKACSERSRRARRRSNAHRCSNGRRWRRSAGGSGRGASGEEDEETAEKEDARSKKQGTAGQRSRGSRRSTSDEHVARAMRLVPVQ